MGVFKVSYRDAIGVLQGGYNKVTGVLHFCYWVAGVFKGV